MSVGLSEPTESMYIRNCTGRREAEGLEIRIQVPDRVEGAPRCAHMVVTFYCVVTVEAEVETASDS